MSWDTSQRLEDRIDDSFAPDVSGKMLRRVKYRGSDQLDGAVIYRAGTTENSNPIGGIADGHPCTDAQWFMLRSDQL